MRFLVDGQILQTVKRLALRRGELLAAVAFWGRGAGQQTGIMERTQQSAKPTKILCDLLSGACNPEEIRCLQENGVEVKHRTSLHAKVWVNGTEVVVGSANASTNGLGFEGAGSNAEAAIHLKDAKVAKDVRKWFFQQWDLAQCVDSALLETADELWKQKQNSRGTIWKCLITAYEEGYLSDEGRARFKEISLDYYDENYLNVNEVTMADHTCYEFHVNDMLPTSGTVYMDYSRRENGERFKFEGFWEVIHNEQLHANDYTLCLLKKKNNRGFRVPYGCGGRQGIDTMVNCYLDNNEQDSLDLEFREFYFLQRQRCLNIEQQCANCPIRRRQ